MVKELIETSNIVEAYTKMISAKNYNAKELSKALSDATKHVIDVKVINTAGDDMFIMSITPDKSTMEKLSENIVNNESKLYLINELWKKTASWTLKIDNKIFNFLNAEELTALTLHEIGHMIDGDSITTRLIDVVQVGLANTRIGSRAIMRNELFNKVANLPIITACHFHIDRNGLTKELKADKMAVSSGYLKELLSAMEKIERKISSNKKYDGIKSVNADIAASIDYMNQILNNLEHRKTSLVKKNIKDLMRHSPEGSSIYESAEDIMESWYYVESHQSSRDKYIEDLASRIANDQYVTEFGIGRNLEPIKRDQIDYIRVKIDKMTTTTDKLMLLSYINSKVELAQYYLAVLDNKKLSKKYKVPHDSEYLKDIITTLEKLRTLCIDTKLIDTTPRIVVGYPSGYEG